MFGAQVYSFGPLSIVEDHVFLTTDLSYAFVNLKPVLPGMVCLLHLGDLWWNESERRRCMYDSQMQDGLLCIEKKYKCGRNTPLGAFGEGWV